LLLRLQTDGGLTPAALAVVVTLRAPLAFKRAIAHHLAPVLTQSVVKILHHTQHVPDTWPSVVKRTPKAQHALPGTAIKLTQAIQVAPVVPAAKLTPPAYPLAQVVAVVVVLAHLFARALRPEMRHEHKTPGFRGD